MANIIDWFNGLFKNENKQSAISTSNQIDFDYLPSLGGSFSPSHAETHNNPTLTSAVDAIARNGAKLKPIHYINQGEGSERINRLLQTQPNPYQSTYDFQYKVISTLFLHNNSFVYIERDGRGSLTGLYPIKGQSMQFGLDADNELVCKFTYSSGFEVYIPYSELIHLRRNYSSDELLGDNNSSLTPLLKVSGAQLSGTIRGIELGANLRGIVNYQTTLSPETLKKRKDEFTSQYLSLENSGGVVATDQSVQYTPIDSKPYTISEQQINTVSNQIYNYLGINPKIVSSDYNEDEFASFYESVIEPLAIQLSLEFTNKLFTDREKAYGNKIEFTSIGLQFASMESKTKLLKEIIPMGLVTINEARSILNLPKLTDEDGNKRLQSLNYADTAIVNEYQLEAHSSVNGQAGTHLSMSNQAEGNSSTNDQQDNTSTNPNEGESNERD